MIKKLPFITWYTLGVLLKYPVKANEARSILAVCWFAILIFVNHCELRVVVLGPGSRGREEYGSNYDSKQQKNPVFPSFSQY